MKIWLIIYKASWYVLGILAILVAASLFTPQVKQYKENQRQKTELKEQIKVQEQIYSERKRQQERMQYDPAYVERVAREEFGLAKPGETVYRITEEPAE